MQHTAPSTYILRELIDVRASDAVSWWPGFEYLPNGWWYVILLLSISAILLMIIALTVAWKNRYRYEALTALKKVMAHAELQHEVETQCDSIANQKFAQQLFYILKQVLIYIEPQSAKLADSSVLIRFDTLMKSTKINQQSEPWQSALSQRWIDSLYNPNIHLTNDDIARLNKQSQHWLKQHRNPFSANPFSTKPLPLHKGQ